jgi:hypothetical protein
MMVTGASICGNGEISAKAEISGATQAHKPL